MPRSLFRAGYPELEVEYEWQREQQMLRLRVKQVQKADDEDEVIEAFRFPVEIELVTIDPGAVGTIDSA